jgi:hypothetical protein
MSLFQPTDPKDLEIERLTTERTRMVQWGNLERVPELDQHIHRLREMKHRERLARENAR